MFGSVAKGEATQESDIDVLVSELFDRSSGAGNGIGKIVLRNYLEQKMANSREKIRRFEEKYGVDVETFYDKLGTEIPLSLEYEGDYLEWDFELAKLKSMEEKYRELESKHFLKL